MNSATIQVTAAKVFLNPAQDEHLKAFATITLNGCVEVADIKVIKSKEGLSVTIPARRKEDGTFQDIIRPLTQEAREQIEQSVMKAYEQETGRR